MFRHSSKMMFVEVVWLFSLCSADIEVSSHWMVTESGLIQPKVEPPFEMENPFDLLAFLSQDTRWDNIISLYHDLSQRQVVAANLWSTLQDKSDITSLILNEDICHKGSQLSNIDWFASFLEEGKSKKIPDEEYSLWTPTYGQDIEVPDCKKISSLTFSMFAFEHLEGVKHRENLTASPELALPELISPIMNMDQFGHWLNFCLKRNSSSWLHYNMASLYWRVRGNTPKALECSRRALHYAPRQYKDVALLSMGTILHRSKRTEDAIIVLGAAVDHDPTYHINHFILATAYAVLGDYNSSVKYLDASLELEPSFEMAVKYKYGVQCHAALSERMNEIRKIVDELRIELTEYSIKEAYWLRNQSAFLRTMKHTDKDDDFRNVIKNAERMTELTGLNIIELKRQLDRYSVIQYFLDGPVSIAEKLQDNGVFALEPAYSLQRLVKHVEKHANMAENYVHPDLSKLMDTEEVLKEISVPGNQNPFAYLEAKEAREAMASNKGAKEIKTQRLEDTYIQFFTGQFLYPPSMKINRNLQDFDREHLWPSNRHCKEAAPNFPENLEAIYPVFVPLENKGIRLSKLLSDKIGVPVSEEYELPWYPPLCPQEKEATAFLQKKSKNLLPVTVVDNGYLRQKLLEYASDGDPPAVAHMQDVEIGHRIYVAMQRKIAPPWLLYLLSSLYWRVRGNNANALHCLLSANKKVEPKFRDLVMGSLASLYLEMGHFEESLSATEEGFKLGVYEPALNFVLSELNMLRKHRNTHIFHLKQVIRVEPNFMGGIARNLLSGWACILKQVKSEIAGYSDDICTQVEPGVNMVCGKDGNNCHVTNIACFNNRDKDSGTIVRLLGLRDKRLKETPEIVDDSIFNDFKQNMPAERTNMLGHQQNYELMIRSVLTGLQGCGQLGCHGMNPEHIKMSVEDCTLEPLDLTYWLSTVAYKQMLEDFRPGLQKEVSKTPPAKNKEPECDLPTNPVEDFFLDRMMRVDIEGWQPIASLMHQIAEVFEFYDFNSLGYRLTKYVENKPMDWEGLLAAGWWCGASGRALCALRCFGAAHFVAPPEHAIYALRALAILLHSHKKEEYAKEISYLAFYASPTTKVEALLMGISHAYTNDHEPAVWMYRYAVFLDPDYLAAKALVHASVCVILYGDSIKHRTKDQVE